jgi:arylsulfatase
MSALFSALVSPHLSLLSAPLKIFGAAFVTLIILLSITTNCQADSIKSAQPNIVIIMADDMGYSDLGCYGGEIETPNIDNLASNGVRFTQFYNTARCCPTRAALLTGLYQHQAGIGHMVGDYGVPSYQGRLNDQCLTIAEALKPAGYMTLATGKWHVGSDRGHWPLDRGFDRYFGTPSGGGFYFKEAIQFRKRFVILGNEEVEFPDDGYVTDLFTEHAINFVEEVAEGNKPFFLYLAHIAPHWPLQARLEDIDKYNGRYDEGWDAIRAARYERQLESGLIDRHWKISPRHKDAKPWSEMSDDKKADLSYRMSVYAAQIDSIDQNVGRLTSKLQELGKFENTIIMFLSDNGCSAEGGPGGFRRGDKTKPIGTGATYASAGLEWANVSDTPFQKFKMSTQEGGISTPLIVHWPAGLKRRGDFEREPGHVVDLMPTSLALADATFPEQHNGKTLKPLAGRSLLPALRGEKIHRDGIFWEHQGNKAVRVGDWKLVKSHKGPWQLFNLASDRTELSDVSKKHPARVRDLTARWNAWAKRSGVLPWPIKKKKTVKAARQ